MRAVLEKCHGLRNDCLVFDPNKNALKLSQENVKLIYDRHFGVGSDGILGRLILEKGKMEARIWNPDGSTAGKSSNGTRIFTRYLKDVGYAQKTHVTLSTPVEDMDVQYLNEEGARMKTPMGKVSFWSDETPASGERREVVNETTVSRKILYHVTRTTAGNPHCVVFPSEISKGIMCRVGKSSEDASYFPERVNTQITCVIGRQNVEIEIYERDAGYTPAPGSSGCAAVATTYKQGLTDPKVHVRMLGETLEVEIFNDWAVLMTGDVSFVGTMQLGDILVEQLQTLE